MPIQILKYRTDNDHVHHNGSQWRSSCVQQNSVFGCSIRNNSQRRISAIETNPVIETICFDGLYFLGSHVESHYKIIRGPRYIV